MNLGHMPFPIVFARERFTLGFGVVTAWNRTMKLLLLLMSIVYVTLQMRLCSESLPAVLIGAFVVFAVIALVMPGVLINYCDVKFKARCARRHLLELMWLVKDLRAARFVASKQASFRRRNDRLRRRTMSEVGTIHRRWRRAINLRGRRIL